MVVIIMSSRHPLALDVRKKNRKKAIRTVVQIMILVSLAWIFIRNLLVIELFDEPDRTSWAQRDGFVALSYAGVSRTGSSQLVADDLLAEHLEALKEQGFETISQQDIIDYYAKGEALPEKALFLAFEDGRKDSTLYAQPLLERLNYRATIMTYARQIIHHERKFLRPKDLKKLLQTGYWEWGSKGNRLAYINILTRDGQFFNLADDTTFKRMGLAGQSEYYNHYLMDFLRDQHMIPSENRDEMFARIDEDYRMLEETYLRSMGTIPKLYMITHANSLYAGMNRLVAEANDRNIKRVFEIHFNREGDAYNRADADIYDLTRLQVAPYWSTNHLLMMLSKDSGMEIPSVVGDEERAAHWELVNGAAQYTGERIILTSLPGQEGLVLLKDTDQLTDLRLTVELKGNVIGEHGLLLRYDQEAETYLAVRLRDNRLIVEEKREGQRVEARYEKKLDEPARWSSEPLNTASGYIPLRFGRDEAAEDKRPYPIHVSQTRELAIEVKDDRLTVLVDGKELLRELPVQVEQGTVALTSRYSEWNERDDIFDAVFDRLVVEQVGSGEAEQPKPQASEQDHSSREDIPPPQADEEPPAADYKQSRLIYDGRMHGLERWLKRASDLFDAVVDWAIDAF